MSPNKQILPPAKVLDATSSAVRLSALNLVVRCMSNVEL